MSIEDHRGAFMTLIDTHHLLQEILHENSEVLGVLRGASIWVIHRSEEQSGYQFDCSEYKFGRSERGRNLLESISIISVVDHA
jgi:hypothetical protein